MVACRGLALGGLLHDPDNNSGLPGGGSSATAAPSWEHPWWDVMNNIRHVHVQLRNTYALEVIGLLIGPAAMFVAIKHLFPRFPNPG